MHAAPTKGGSHETFVLAAAVTVLAVLAIYTAAGAVRGGGRTYDNADLQGVYYFVTTQVRMTYPPGGTEKVVEYCSGYGEAYFDGVATVVIASVDRCSISGTSGDKVSQSYEVSNDGTFLVRETAYPSYATHCRMVDHGRTLLCDGTASGSDTLSFSVVAVKE